MHRATRPQDDTVPIRSVGFETGECCRQGDIRPRSSCVVRYWGRRVLGTTQELPGGSKHVHCFTLCSIVAQPLHRPRPFANNVPLFEQQSFGWDPHHRNPPVRPGHYQSAPGSHQQQLQPDTTVRERGMSDTGAPGPVNSRIRSQCKCRRKRKSHTPSSLSVWLRYFLGLVNLGAKFNCVCAQTQQQKGHKFKAVNAYPALPSAS